MDEYRLPPKFWFGLIAGTGVGIFVTCLFLGNWWHQMPATEVIFFAKILAWLIMIAGAGLALFSGRRTH